MAIIFAVDPGTTKTAWLQYRDSDRTVHAKGIHPNERVRDIIKCEAAFGVILAIEQVASYGMAVGQEVFETCVWTGRFIEAFGDDSRVVRLPRKQIVTYLCGSARAKDANVRQRLIDIFGGSKEAAIGKKSSPGPLYGVHDDEWSALAIALTAESVLKEQALLATKEQP